MVRLAIIKMSESGISWSDVDNMPVYIRGAVYDQLKEEIEEKNKQQKKQAEDARRRNKG